MTRVPEALNMAVNMEMDGRKEVAQMLRHLHFQVQDLLVQNTYLNHKLSYNDNPHPFMDAARLCHEIHKNGGTAWDCWYTLQARSRK